MPPRFQKHRDRLLEVVDRELSETIEVKFLVGQAVDPARPAQDIRCILRSKREETASVTGGKSETWKRDASATPSQLHIDYAVWATIDLRKGDKVRATDRPGQPWFEVLAIDDRAHPRAIVSLGETS